MDAMIDFGNKFYSSAARTFKSLGNYQDSYEMWQGSMIGYIGDHYDNSDTTTYEYIKTLIDLGNDSVDHERAYHELYDWRVERAFVNADDSDKETERHSISRSETWWAHFLIQGGTPGETLNTYVKVKAAGDSFYIADFKSENYSLSDGTYLAYSWYYETPSTGKTGTWVMDLFNAETNELLGSATVVITR